MIWPWIRQCSFNSLLMGYKAGVELSVWDSDGLMLPISIQQFVDDRLSLGWCSVRASVGVVSMFIQQFVDSVCAVTRSVSKPPAVIHDPSNRQVRFCHRCEATILTVGPARMMTPPSEALSLSRSGVRFLTRQTCTYALCSQVSCVSPFSHQAIRPAFVKSSWSVREIS